VFESSLTGQVRDYYTNKRVDRDHRLDEITSKAIVISESRQKAPTGAS
jgi:hypothetical protein